MNLLNNFSNAIVAKNQADADANHEQFSVTKVTTSNNKFDITVQNSGNIPINITRLWVQNKTNPDWGTAKFIVNQPVYPGHSVSIGQNLALTAMPTKGYDLKLVTARGNTNEFFVNSVSQEPVYMQLYALPASGGPNSFNTTLLFAVTNNMTNGGALSNIQANLTVTPAVGVTATSIAPDPMAYPLLKNGDVAYFQWQYKINGTNGQKVNFKASLKNEYGNNFVSQDVALTNVTSGKNIGKNGTGFYVGTTANNLKFKNVTAGPGITITSNPTDVTISSNVAGSSGTNIGTHGKGVYAGVVGSILKFKNVTGSNGITVTSNSTDVTITGSGGGSSSTGINIGTHGKGFYAGVSGSTLQFKNATAGTGMTITSNATDVTFSVSGGGSSGATGPTGATGQAGSQGMSTLTFESLTALSTSSTDYVGIYGHSTTESNNQLTMPIGGHITKMYCNTSVAAGSGNTYTFSVRLDSANPSNAVSCTISGSSQTSNSVTMSSTGIVVTAGQLIDIRSVPSSGPTAASATITLVLGP